MGRQPWSDRRTVERSRVLAVATLVRSGLFVPWVPWLVSGELRFDELVLKIAWQSRWPHRGEEPPETDPKTVGTIYLSYEVPRPEAEIAAEVEAARNRHLGAFVIPRRRAVQDEVEIAAIPSPLNWRKGKRRYFFVCPGRDGRPCGRRAGKLYLPPGELYFRCRQCHNLTYRSSKEHDKRVDALLRSPIELVQGLFSREPRKVIPALKAYLRMCGII